MKREIFKETAIILLSLCLVFIFGCSKNSSLNQPDDISNSAVNKSSHGTAMDSWRFLTLPPELGLLKGKKGKSKAPNWSVTEEVDSNKKVKLKIKEDYESVDGKIEVEIKVEIKKNCLAPGSFITMTFDPSTGLVSFLPHMIFDQIAKVSVKLKGLKEDVDGADIDFVFLGENGEYVAIDKKHVKFKYKDGLLNEVSIKDVDGLNCARYAFKIAS